MKTRMFLITLVLPALVIPVRLAAGINQEGEHHERHRHYRLVDLGTFGGPESYINPAFTFGCHNQINRRGTVVGGSGISIPTTPVSDGFVCGGLDGTVPFVNHAFKWKHGTLTDLGALPEGNNCSVATSINARGDTVGVSENGVIDPVLGTNAIRGVLWHDGKIMDLETLGGTSSSADEINGRGQVVGFAFNAIPDPVSIIYFGLAGLTNGTQTRAYLWEDGVMQDLGTLGGPDAVALFLNEHGQVAGFSYTNSTPDPVTGVPTTHPFVWTEEAGMKDLGSLGGSLGWVNSESGGFNNRGEMIGISNLAGDQIAHPFLWDGDKLIDLFTETVGGSPLSANDINDAGEIVGGAAFPNHPFDAFLWKNGVATDLGTLPGDCFSEAFAINAKGQVVGQSVSCDFLSGSVFLWENGTMIDLQRFVPSGSGLQLAEAQAINDRGEIAGDLLPPGCTDDTQCGHAFVLIPCDHDNSYDEEYQEGCGDNTERTGAETQGGSAPHIQSAEATQNSLAGATEVSNTAAAARWLLGIPQPSSSMKQMMNPLRNR